MEGLSGKDHIEHFDVWQEFLISSLEIKIKCKIEKLKSR